MAGISWSNSLSMALMLREFIKEGSWKLCPNQEVDQGAVVLDQGIGMITEAGTTEAAAGAGEGMIVIGIMIEIGIHATGAGVAV